MNSRFNSPRFNSPRFNSPRFAAPLWLVALAAVALLGKFSVAQTPAAAPFTFTAFGCLPYASAPDSAAGYARLLAEVNRQGPVFSVHLGDTMSSSEKATDALLLQRRDEFNSLATALIYTPGDNEWTDTHTEKAGGFVPTERLARIREIYFKEERSLGQKPIALATQRRDPKFAKFVENARWTHGGVMFATVHVVGSSNNRQPKVPGAMEEYRERDEANVAWLRATFAEATKNAAPGLALFFQAAPFIEDGSRPGYADGFERFLKTTEELARAFAKPVRLVPADEHRYRLNFGLRFHAAGEVLPNVTRIESFGANNVHAVLVTVDPSSQAVFLPGPLLIPGNALPVLPRPKGAK